MYSKDLKYLLAYILPLSGMVSIYYASYFSFLTVIIAFGLLPVLDYHYPKSTNNFNSEQKAQRLKSLFFDALLYINVPLVYIVLFMFLMRLGYSALDTWEIFGLCLSTGIVLSTSGINVAHELGHKPSTISHVASQLLLLPSMYMHFFIEHNRGHHLHVSTPEDPASARKGESVYKFFFRSIPGQWINAWRLEKKRLKSHWHFSNLMMQFTIIQVVFVSLIFYAFGPLVGLLYLAVALQSLLMLELINYIEHYGLRRKKLENGRYEKVRATHSWNSNHEIGRIFLYELTRHSDHHFKSAKKYQILDHHDDSPQLPYGYPASLLLSLIPPLWFRIMDNRIPSSNSINY